MIYKNFIDFKPILGNVWWSGELPYMSKVAQGQIFSHMDIFQFQGKKTLF